MKKEKMLVLNGGTCGWIIVPVPVDWNNKSDKEKRNYKSITKKNAKSGGLGQGFTTIPDNYKKIYDLVD